MIISYSNGKILKQQNGSITSFAMPSSFVSQLKPNKKAQPVFFHFEKHYPIKLSQLIASEMREELIKQEMPYQTFFSKEKQKQNALLANKTTEELQTEFAKPLLLAKHNYIKQLFQQLGQNYFSTVQNTTNVEELKNMNQMALLRREVFNNPEFLTQVVEELERPNSERGMAITVAQSFARDLEGVYQFQAKEELANYLANQQAKKMVLDAYNSAPAAVVEKVEERQRICSLLLDGKIAVNKSLNQNNILNAPLDPVTSRLNTIHSSITNGMKFHFYNQVVKDTHKTVFQNGVAPQKTLEQVTSTINIPLLLDEYHDEISLVYKNNAAMAKLNHDIMLLKAIQSKNTRFEFDLKGKFAELNFYKVSTEFLYDAIELNERQKAVKNAIGSATSTLLGYNENQLVENRISQASKVLLEVLPNANQEFINGLNKTFANSTTEPSVEEYYELLLNTIVASQEQLSISRRVDIERYATRIVETVKTEVETQELEENSYFKTYLANIANIKLEVNAKRLMEFCKLSSDLGVMNAVFENNLNYMQAIDSKLVSKQEKEVIASNNLLQKEVGNIASRTGELLQLYTKDETKLSAFTVSFVQSVANEIANIHNPKVRLHLLNAYSEPLIQHGVIANQKELVKVAETLAKRQNPNYLKAEQELWAYADPLNLKEKQDLSMLEQTMPKTAKRRVVKAKTETKQQPKAEEPTELFGKVAQPAAQTQELTQPKLNTVVSEKQTVVEQPVVESKVVENKVVQEEKPQPVAQKPNTEVAQSVQEAQSKPQPEAPKVEAVKPDKSIAQHFKNMEEVNIAAIDQDALQFMKNDAMRLKLESFNELNRKQQVELLKQLNKDDKLASLETNNLAEQASAALQVLDDNNKVLLKKYSKSTDDEKIAFVVLALNKKDEVLNPQKEEEKQIPQVVYKTYDLTNQKEFNSCKNDLFWKMQLKAVQRNIVLEKTLNDETFTEFKQVSPVVKLFEIAASDNVGLSDVQIANIGQLNYQQLARVSILKFKDGKINDPATVTLVNHILTNTSAYSKTTEYNGVVEELLKNPQVASELKEGTLSLDAFISEEEKEGGALEPIMKTFYKKTAPSLPKLLKVDDTSNGNTENDGNFDVNNKITI